MNYPFEPVGRRQWDWLTGIPDTLAVANVEHLADLRAHHAPGHGELRNPPDFADRRVFHTHAEPGGLRTIRSGLAEGCVRRGSGIN